MRMKSIRAGSVFIYIRENKNVRALQSGHCVCAFNDEVPFSFAKPVGDGRIDVEDLDDGSVTENGDDKFASGCGIARDMTGER